MRPHRRRMQMVFQDPYSSLNPRLSAGTIVGEPLENFGIARGTRARRARRRAVRARRPARATRCASIAHEFSGGQRQRLGIARALAGQSRADRRRRAGVGARRLGAGAGAQPADRPAGGAAASPTSSSPTTSRVVEHIGHRVAVMYLGRIVELRRQARRCSPTPLHPYTEALLAAAPVARSAPRQARARSCRATCRARSTRRPGCHFHTRCPYAVADCKVTTRRCARSRRAITWRACAARSAAIRDPCR